MRLCNSLLAAIFILSMPATVLAQALPGTQPLTSKEDPARQMVEGIDRFLTRLTRETVEKHRRDGPPTSVKDVAAARERLRRILGVVDQRLPMTGLELVGGPERQALLAETERYQVYAVRWPVLAGVNGEGLWLRPRDKARASVIVIPDADQTPEELAGLRPGLPRHAQLASRLVEQGCEVLVPALVDRRDTWSGSPAIERFTNQPHREFVYRMSYEMGRHIIGYELQQVLAAVDSFTRAKEHEPIGIYGYGEGGLLALYAAALDPRIDATAVSGYFGPRTGLHAEPIYRNVWGLLKHFGGDAGVAALIAPRGLVIEDAPQPRADGPPAARPGRSGAATGKLPAPFDAAGITEELATAMKSWPGKDDATRRPLLKANAALGDAVPDLLTRLGHAGPLAAEPKEPARLLRDPDEPELRARRQFDQLVNHTESLLEPGRARRDKSFWSRLDTSSPEKFKATQAPLRDSFRDEIIGNLPAPTLPVNARTRLLFDEPRWKGYEVMLDLFDGVICHGILLVPKDLRPGEKRPVVVCQHGLEGRPIDVVNPREKTRYYNSFGAQLADRGFVVFAPQSPYIFEEQFRQLIRKGHPLEVSLYSFIYRQHERILEWLATLPFVNTQRIAFYGLSYGGKVAMRIPALLPGYCLVICSGDFNEWIWKNITLAWAGSYMFTREYDMYEFDLGNRFNYAEMAALIAPRPFMVERGHNDGVGLDEQVAFEYAKVRRLYARLGFPERTAIEFFNGGHEIHGRGTFAFLHRHLDWPEPAR